MEVVHYFKCLLVDNGPLEQCPLKLVGVIPLASDASRASLAMGLRAGKNVPHDSPSPQHSFYGKAAARR